MEQIRNLCHVLYPAKCCDRVLLDHQIPESECIKMIMVKTLGYGIIAASTFVKVPQVLKLMSAKSGLGVSLISVLLELLALSFSSSYSYANGFPFSAWGEALFLMFVTSMIGFLILYYDRSKSQAFLFMMVFATIISILMSGHVPYKVLWTGQALSLPLIITGKLIQVWSNYQNGHTGQLSAITVTLIFIGSSTRIMTSIQETGDQLIIIGFVLCSIINLISLLQIIIYWDRTNEFIKKNKAKKEK